MPITFAIYPNTRGFGFVCLEKSRQLIDYGIVTIRPICNRKVIKRARKFMEYYKPDLVIIQDHECKFTRASKRVIRVLDAIANHAEDKELKVYRYKREQIRDTFSQFSATTKFEIAQILCKEHKELEHRIPKPTKLWMSEDYNMGIFDALSLAYTHYYLTS